MSRARFLWPTLACVITGVALYVTRGVLDESMTARGVVRFAVLPPWQALAGFVALGAYMTVYYSHELPYLVSLALGVAIGVGSANGESFKWPSWLPIKIKEIGIQWVDIQKDPADFVLTLSASVTGLKGVAGLTFDGAIEGVRIDVGALREGKFPIIDIASIGVSIQGNLFGGHIEAQLVGGILKINAAGQMIDTLDVTTPVEDRVFFVGVQGGFSLAGIGGLTIRFGLSELGPLGVAVEVSTPTGILLEPNTGLSINDFYASVEFFKTLPSIDQPEELRGPAFAAPVKQTAEEWLAQIKQQVVNQYIATKANPGTSGFAAAFTSPMLITGGAKIFTAYASQATFNGEVILRISTDGKFLAIGKLNFLNDKISMTGRLYADISKIAAGEATVLFLADIPDQVQLLTIDGRFKMGFRNPDTGEEATFSEDELATMLKLAKKAIAQLGDIQRKSLGKHWPF